jgi:hypothetical protein
VLLFNAVKLGDELPREHPLYVGKFFQLKGTWWRKRRQRQGLIISVALAWHRLTRHQRSSPGFLTEELYLSRVPGGSADARVILEKFFTIDRLGFNINGNAAPTLVRAKKLSPRLVAEIERLAERVTFDPGRPPNASVFLKSAVSVRPVSQAVLTRLRADGRLDLIAQVEWLQRQGPVVDFYFRPSGRLKARDTSVWPIRAIETWPSWLRHQLFGTSVDIENAFTQFLLSYLKRKHAGREQQLRLKFPDLFRLDETKKEFRAEICGKLLHLDVTEENLSVVKRLVMSLANGSNISGTMLAAGSGRSEAVRIVRQFAPHLSTTQLITCGDRLSHLAKQYRKAKREVCLFLGKKPTLAGQKEVFTLYFQWERSARHALWQALGNQGIQLHDGLDGIINNETTEKLMSRILTELNLKITVKESEDAPTETQRMSPAKITVVGKSKTTVSTL